MHSLRAKIAVAYLSLAALIVGLSAVALYELSRIEDKVREGSKVSELFDATLELRRFEKNHFLYGQPSDLVEHTHFVERARELLQRDSAVIDTLAGIGTAAQLGTDLARYADAMAQHARASDNEALAAATRALGTRIVTVGENLALRERSSVDLALQAHQRNFMVILAVVAVILVAAGVLLAHQVTRPLQAMENRMEAVATGRLTRLTPDSADREIVSLTEAFNHVLDELARRQHTLVRSEKLASLGTLLSGVAHELNNPLSNISSSAQILKEEAGMDPNLRAQLAEDIDAETLRAQRIVRALLDYSGDRAFEPTQVPLAELVEETLRFSKNKRPANIAVDLEIPTGLRIYADRPRLQQVLLNLIVNAYDSMVEQGTLTVSAQQVRVDDKSDDFPVPCGGCRAGDLAVEIRVADTGPGISPDLLERIFDPFFTTKAIGHGSGLGLFVAFEIIEQHEGCMIAANHPDGGALFRIRLPAGRGEPA